MRPARRCSVIGVAALLTVGGCGASEGGGAEQILLPPESSVPVPSDAPAGWTIRALREIDRSQEEAPLADPVIMFARSPDPERGEPAIFASVRPAEEVSGAAPSARVRGKPAFANVPPPYQDLYAAPSLTWQEGPEEALVVWGVHVTRAEIAAVAEHIGLDRSGMPVADDLPDGYVEVGSLEGGWRNETGVGVTLAPNETTSEDDLKSVRVRRAPPEILRVLRALVKDDPDDAYADVELPTFESDLGAAEEVTALGHAAVVGRISPLTRALIIDGDPGIVLLAEAEEDYPEPLTSEELVALAERLEALTPDQFDERLQASYRAEGDRRREELFDYGFGQPIWERAEGEWIRTLHLATYDFRSQAAGRRSDGEPVACLIETPEALDYTKQVDLGDLACAPRLDPDLAATSLYSGGASPREELVWGIVSDDVAEVVIEFSAGAKQTPDLVATEAAGVRLFRLPLPAELVLPTCTPSKTTRAQGISVVAVDGSGAELGRVVTDAAGRFPRQIPC